VSAASFRIVAPDPAAEAAEHARALEGASAEEIIRFALCEAWPGEFAVVSSFGAESAALLHIVSTVDKAAPVIFLDTDRHFAQTLAYRDELVARLGLVHVFNQAPDAAEAAAQDAKGDLWRRDPDACCALRKVRPLGPALAPYAAWATGRKRFHGGLRATLQVVEHDGVHFKVNPLASWRAEDIAAYMAAHDLPQHPLVEQGFPSIGCWPCTQPAETPGRSGRWAGLDKTECGIHVPASARRQAF
jgi:phosphoadenosine phosphosulfate reductase